ncbi:MAG TPA: enolase C-terminal domain-like protein [Acidimicrobiales bacterium]|nr:enolase C-terminal domain-like protein [Acidimicrobiales bacterium]
MTVSEVTARAYKVPTDQPEADGTLSWDATVVVVVTVTDGDRTGLGYTYAGVGAATVITEHLKPVVLGGDPAAIPQLAEDMARAVRNLGRPGLVACAISAVDVALWDLRARQLGVSLADLFGRARPSVPVYGSGGFTTYDDETTAAQLAHWVGDWGMPRVKIKIGESWGQDSERDLHRIALARRLIGDVELYVDANGGYQVKQAIRLGRIMADQFDVTWFEEPVSSDDLAGLATVRGRFAGEVAAGEYGYTADYFARMLDAGAVDCLQADATRCGGYTVWRHAAALAAAHHLQISGHCAPNLHAHVAASVPNLRHLEYFHDHHRIETLLFDGTLPPNGGTMTPDRAAPGHGLSFKQVDAEEYRVA